MVEVFAPKHASFFSKPSEKQYAQLAERAFTRASFFYQWPLGYIGYPHQLEWLDFIQAYSRTCLMAPVDHGKTNTVSTGYSLYKYYQNPDIRICTIAGSKGLPEKILAQVGSQMEDNTDLQWAVKHKWGIYPIKPEKPKRWNKEQLLANRLSSLRDVRDSTFTSSSPLSHILGSRFDLIIGDDVTPSETELQTAENWAKIVEWWRTVVISRLEPSGEGHLIGTPYSELDLLHWAMSAEKGKKPYKYRIYRALVRDDESFCWQHN